MGHTPGPWWIEEPDDPAEDDRHISDSEGNTATVYGDPETSMANARLIAAAPELLEVCREAVSAITYLLSNDDDDPNYADTLNTLAAAIAKAEGTDAVR